MLAPEDTEDSVWDPREVKSRALGADPGVTSEWWAA